MDYREMCINRDTNVRDAMKTLDITEAKILFITDKERLIATLTDGDIRRFLMAGGGLEDFVEKAGNHSPLTAENEKQAVKLYHEKNYKAIPVVNGKGEIIDIYLGRDSFAKRYNQLVIPVVINAGGRGTRLDPFTRVLPKPLIPVGDLPIIEHIMQEFKKYASDNFHVIVNYKKQLIKAYFSESENKYDITWYDEEKPLGTGGGLSLLKGNLQETFFFTNCDILLQSDYESIFRFHRENNNTITMICAYKNLTIPYGVIEMGLNGSIEAIKEKPEVSFLTNTGMYIVEPEVLEDIQDSVSIGFPDIVEEQKKKGRNVAVYPISENEWFDMGQLSELEKMRERLYGE